MDWNKITAADLRENAPSVVEIIEREAKSAAEKLIAENADKIKVVEEQATLLAKLRTTLGIDEDTDLLDSIVLMLQKVEKAGREAILDNLDTVLGRKVKNDAARSAIRRLMPVTEMEGLDEAAMETKVTEIFNSDTEIKALVAEMEGLRLPGGIQ